MDLLTLIIFGPMLGMFVILCMPREARDAIRTLAAVATAVPLLLASWLWTIFETGQAGYQFVLRIPWISTLGVEYHVGIDGLSLPLVWLATLLLFLAVIASWRIEMGVKGYFLLLLLLETGILGVFCALDLFLFFVCWEVVLLPMYFLIGVWGGPRREYAAIKFFLFTLVGSVLMLLGIVALYLAARGATATPLSIPQLSAMIASGELTGDNLVNQGMLLGWPFLKWIFVFFFIGFAIKVPIVPFHTWLPDAHVEAPTPISVILAGILLKLGTYGILRFNLGMFPNIAPDFSLIGAWIGLVAIIYGAFVAMAQTDFKRLVAYSSVSHMGYVLLGASAFTSAGLNGAAMQMFTHGTSSALLFLIVGVAYDRAHHREIAGFGGLAKVAPIYFGVTSVGMFAALGLPGMSGFVSEVLVLIGAWQTYPALAAAAVLGIVVTAAFILWTLQRVFLGPLNEKYADFPDASRRELFTMVPLAFLCVLLGVVPSLILDWISPTMEGIGSLLP